MHNVRLFPVSRCRAFVEKAVSAIAALPNDPEAWRAFHKPLALSLLDRGVGDERVDLELCFLHDRAARIATQRAAAPVRKAGRRLRLVQPAQLDLFASRSEPAISKLEGDIAEGDR